MESNSMQKTIGVVGAGVMGIDVATSFAAFGHKVILMDSDSEVRDSAFDRMKKNIRGYKMLSPLCKDYDYSAIAENITIVDSIESLKDADWIVENITEDLALKKSFYKEIGKIAKEDVKYAVNTSCISITELGQYVPKPENMIGMHFMNPVPLKECVEGVRGYHTSEDTEIAAQELLKSIKKYIVIVNDSPGFVANRLSHIFMNEAAYLVMENVAEPKKIDAIFKAGYGHKSGPLETADLIGLDTVVNSLNILYESYQDDKFKCCPLLKKMVAAGLLGKKSGQGFYKY